MSHKAKTRIVKRLLRRLRARDGYSLIEVIVAMTSTLVVFGAVMTVVVAAANIQNHTSNRTEAEFTAQSGVAELGRLIRQATSVAYVTSGNQTKISLSGGPLGATTIDCSSGACIVSGGSTGQPLSSVSNTDVFTLWCRATGSSSSDLTTSGCSSYKYLTVRVVIAISCSHEEVHTCASNTVELDDGFNVSS
ncbi:MAG: PulJ/GspJ family protein [Solirubrobacteraceae bacterium]